MLACYAIIVFVLICLSCLYVFYIPLIVRMPQRKLQSMNLCLIYRWYIAEELFCSNMNISLQIWRAVIGLFLSCNIGKCLISELRCYSISNIKFTLFFLCHGDIESNSGPKKFVNSQPLKFCHWNLNNMTPMTECLVLGMPYNKLVIVSVIYCSPSQFSQEFTQFEMLLSQLLNNITSKHPFFP